MKNFNGKLMRPSDRNTFSFRQEKKEVDTLLSEIHNHRGYCLKVAQAVAADGSIENLRVILNRLNGIETPAPRPKFRGAPRLNPIDELRT